MQGKGFFPEEGSGNNYKVFQQYRGKVEKYDKRKVEIVTKFCGVRENIKKKSKNIYKVFQHK